MRIAFTAADTPRAQEARARLVARYGDTPLNRAEVLVCLGGDGFMLDTLRFIMGRQLPVYGLNYGTVGFLMNQPKESDGDALEKRLLGAQPTIIAPLHMKAITTDGNTLEGMGFNDVFLYRQTRQAIHVRIEIDGRVRMEDLTADGVIVATPAGSTAYNRSVQGPILPLGSNLLSLAPICPFHPRHWRGALLPEGAEVRFVLKETWKRPASAVAGATEVRDVAEATIKVAHKDQVQLLFDPDHELSERIIAEQFAA
ncbi:NAD kinase [Formicincola oecophyllae]|uniref:NAD kinase n=1 Tax=Formicincola oecophyllae TaxID=2558361 RepID=A0A4Y6UC65_9PROT|nr:NAD kinase [Formicincola oecophyllae]QDH14047.1 NAD kinase [Formicincola oecophyllae]